MDLKSKRIFEISQMVICISMLLLYTKIGGIGTVYVAIVAEIVFCLFLLFLYSTPYVITQSTKTAAIYCLISTILVECLLWLTNHFLIIANEIMFVSTLLNFFMFLVPAFAFWQFLKGVVGALVEPQVGAISNLIFWVFTMVGTIVTYVISGNYGKKAAILMQSVKFEYFYVIICLFPGILIGFLSAFAFLMWIAFKQGLSISALFEKNTQKKENIILAISNIFFSQLSYSIIPILQRIPIWILLLLSIKEIKADNYLFGHFYGAVLPLFQLMWNFFGLALVSYKKRLYIFSKKRIYEQRYKELRTVLAYVIIYSVYFFVCVFALHKSYLAIWSMQTSSDFMSLLKASALIVCFGFMYTVLTDILKEKNAHAECTVAVFLGTLFCAIIAAICHNFLGVGTTLYVLSISMGLLVSTIVMAWFISNDVGIHYLSIFLKSYKALLLCAFIGVILVILQNLIFTALGGLATLIICALTGYLLLRLGLIVFSVFTKQERKLLSFITTIKAVLQISK